MIFFFSRESHTRMVFKGALLVGSFQLSLGGCGRDLYHSPGSWSVFNVQNQRARGMDKQLETHPKDIIELSFLDHCDVILRRDGVRWKEKWIVVKVRVWYSELRSGKKKLFFLVSGEITATQ